MQKKKNIAAILVLATILTTLCALPGFQPAEAYVTTPVQAGPLYRSDYGWLCAHYGYEVAYDSTGGSDDEPYFYPSLEVVTQGLVGLNYYTIYNMKITVTGTKPDGTAISGINFGDLAQINSPKDTGTEWAGALTALWNVLKGYDPYHITSAITLADQSGGSIGYDSQSAWANWNWGAVGQIQKGLQFRFKLLCDPSLGGTYTLTIQYHMDIFVGQPGSGYIVNTSDFYQTITYEYTPPHVSSIAGSGLISMPAGYGDETNMIGYAADDNIAYIGAMYGGAAYISGMLNTERSGQTDIWLHGYAYGPSVHVYVYVSTDNYNWQYVNDLMIYQTNNAPIHVGTTQNTYRYVLICNYNDFYGDVSGIAIDCITTT